MMFCFSTCVEFDSDYSNLTTRSNACRGLGYITRTTALTNGVCLHVAAVGEAAAAGR